MELSPQHQQTLLNAARTCIRETLRGSEQIAIPTINDPALRIPAGCFVTLHERGTHHLRGCIGRIQASDPLIKTLCEIACSVLHDPRFRLNPVTIDELPRLDLEISVLSPLKLAAHPLDFEPPNDGIFLVCDGRTGTFLPQVARETGWTREQLLARLCTEKMGLPADSWQGAQAKLYKYTVFLIGPVPFIAGPEKTPALQGAAITNNGNTFWVL